MCLIWSNCENTTVSQSFRGEANSELIWKSGCDCALFPSSRCNSPHCAPDCINKGWLIEGPGVCRGRAAEPFRKTSSPPTYLVVSAEPYLRDCRMAFMKQVLPKLRRPVAPSATPSWQRQVRHIFMYWSPVPQHEYEEGTLELSLRDFRLTLSFNNLLSGAGLSWSFLFLCLSPISAELEESNTLHLDTEFAFITLWNILKRVSSWWVDFLWATSELGCFFFKHSKTIKANTTS